MAERALAAGGLERFIEPLIELTRAAAREVLAVYRSDFGVDEKPDHTPLTAGDRVSHALISAGLGNLTPGLPILSEEGPIPPYEQRRGWRSYWLVDPLDGTREFVRRNGEFSINVALVRNHRPVVGVIHRPVTDTVYFAYAGGGAYKHCLADAAAAASIRVVHPCRRPPRVAMSRFRPGRRLQGFLHCLGPHETVAMGSTLKLCLVAEGSADLYPSFGPTSEWDTAAGQCLLEEAGGAITDLDMKPLRYNTKESLRNPCFLAFGDIERNWAACL